MNLTVISTFGMVPTPLMTFGGTVPESGAATLELEDSSNVLELEDGTTLELE